MIPTTSGDEPVLSPSEVAQLWIENRARFLGFLRFRTTTAEADEILQAAFVRALEGSSALRRREAVVAWFYRVLRSTLVDHQRKRGRERRALDEISSMRKHAVVEDVPRAAPCPCAAGLLPELKPEYSEMLERVELRGERVIDVAHGLGISANNAAVRLGRARRALRTRVEKNCGSCAAGGCFECSCGAVE